MTIFSAETELFSEIYDNYTVNTEYLNVRRTVYCEKSQKLTDEKYILNINRTKINIECSGKKSEFYALCDISKRIRENRMADGEYVCSPSFPVRGYIEGFYGTPWSHENRKSVMTLMAKNRMNTVYYAPKDDLYHREKWRDTYPSEELTSLKELFDLSKSCYMDFYWCIAPGLSMKYSDENEFDALIRKTKQLSSIGITHFGLLLDDIDEDLEYEEDKAKYGETVNAHIDLISRYHSALRELNSISRLTVCPTLYHGKGNEYYISKLGQNIPSEVSLFWTGKDICSRELLSFDALKFIENTRHKPLYWDNYPVNDCSMYNEMHISPIINRDCDLWKYSEGIIANCMEYAECSKIPLVTIADYLWDSENYDSEKSFENAIKQVIGEEYGDAFTVFADHLYTSCLKDANSRRMYDTFDKIENSFRKGDKDKAFSIAAEYIEKMLICKEFLSKDLPICAELSKWSSKFCIFCDIIQKVSEYIKTGQGNIRSEIFSLTEQYNSNPARFSNDIDLKKELTELFDKYNFI